MTFTSHEIHARFGKHSASIEGHPDQKEETHEKLRFLLMRLVGEIDGLVPDGRAKSVAMTELETASMWFHKALAQQ